MESSKTFGLGPEGTHNYAEQSFTRLLADSEDLGWRSLYACRHIQKPYAARAKSSDHDGIAYQCGGVSQVTCAMDGRVETQLFAPRRFSIVPKGIDSGWSHDGSEVEVLHLYVRRAELERVAAEMWEADAAQAMIIPRFCAFDPVLEQFALAVLRLLHAPQAGHAFYIDCLAQGLAAHLLQHHAARTYRANAEPDIGSADHLFRRAVDYIEAHLGEDFSLDELAAASGLSKLYVSRAFKRALGLPPHQYLLDRRIERAKHLLIEGELPIAQVALACGFADQSHFSHAFKQRVGVTPKAFRTG